MEISAFVWDEKLHIVGAHPFLTRATSTELLAIFKPHAGELVVGWVTTCESSMLLYVFVVLSFTTILNASSTPKRLLRAWW
ncbi:hypothetical protein VN97_g12909 [Penicillium thymicola]|uniref:Uncharacterized protein n=1 Tax=Penicillium thymicola TaxID=293382 RepID=A0AAI9T5J8_PENTH|nr:hypothetical protein VN97_g12909 [Penicillium thymicola]